jgi:probable rRNA maturation factor
MGVDVVIEDARWEALDLPELADRAAAATLARLGLSAPWEVALLATSDADIARLNAEFRGKPDPTNVLSWPAQPLAPPAPGQPPPPPAPDVTGELALGDVALAWETCAREAEIGGKPLADHTMHLVVHAILHLLGYDHICDEDAGLMEGLETEILEMLGVSDPYSTGSVPVSRA